MDNLEFANASRRMVIETFIEVLDKAVANSNGEDSMSPSDMKIAILSLQVVVGHQDELIKTLYAALAQPSKKPWYRRLFK